MSIKVVVRVDRLRRLYSSLQTRSTAAVKDSAEYMRDYASRIAPRDTGSLSTSFYVSGPGNRSDYALRASAARRLNPRAVIVDEIRAAAFDSRVRRLRAGTGRFAQSEAIVAAAVEHGLFQEEGTRYMAPQPSLRPAAEATRSRFHNAMRRVADDA